MAFAYRIAKGPVVVLLEQFLATDQVGEWYDQLVDEAQYVDGEESTLFEDFLKAKNAAFHAHLEQDVFGPGKGDVALPPGQLEAAKARGRSRRLVYWRGLRRALEIAHGFGGAARDPQDHWTLDIYWGCGHPANAVSLSTDADKKIVTVIVYSDQAAVGDDGSTVVPWDPATTPPNPAGDLFFVDDRDGVGTVKEWQATKMIGYPTSPDAPPPN